MYKQRYGKTPSKTCFKEMEKYLYMKNCSLSLLTSRKKLSAAQNDADISL